MNEHTRTGQPEQNDQDSNPGIEQSDQPVNVEAEAATQDDASAAVRNGGLVVIGIILASLVWYLLADRFTPYSDQARVQGYVVGIAPKVSGLVTQVWIQNNQEVKEGEELFQIDTSQYEIALEQARSGLQSAQRQVGAGSAGVSASRSALRAAQADELKARQEAERLESLYVKDPGAISQRRLESSRAGLDAARARVKGAQADVQRAIEQKGGENDADNAILKSAQSAVDKAQLDLSNTIVRAPAKGIVTDLRADVGQFAGTGSPVMTLISLHDVWIEAQFTENNLGNIQTGTRVEVLLDALPGEVFDGRIRSIGLGVSSGSENPPGTLPTVNNDRDWLRQAQRFPVIVEIDHLRDERVIRQLRVGAHASVMAYAEGHGILEFLGEAYIRLMSILSYAY